MSIKTNGVTATELNSSGVSAATYGGAGTGVGQFTVDGDGRITSAANRAIDLTSSDVTGVLPVANGGTNTSSIGSAGSVAYSTGTAYGYLQSSGSYSKVVGIK